MGNAGKPREFFRVQALFRLALVEHALQSDPLELLIFWHPMFRKVSDSQSPTPASPTGVVSRSVSVTDYFTPLFATRFSLRINFCDGQGHSCDLINK
jgi:hypothetical protein